MNAGKHTIHAALLGLCVLAFSAHAQTAISSDQIDARYRAEMKRCDSLKGNDKDVCTSEAKAARDNARADAKQAKQTAQARQQATKEKLNSGYDVAKQKCDAFKGDAKDACLADAKTRYGK
jgi:hypothetical protein